jgi:hypothetical protein
VLNKCLTLMQYLDNFILYIKTRLVLIFTFDLTSYIIKWYFNDTEEIGI